jgi:lipoate-protein ligase A
LTTEQQWRLLRTGKRNGAENMAIDEAILIAGGEGKAPPTIRFYGWEPPTLSIGYFQRAAREVDLERLKRRGLGFVRRPTGGRAVLHDQELTYSVIVAENVPGMPSSVIQSYRVISTGLLEGFRLLGLAAEMVSLEGKSAQSGSPDSAACFDSPSWYELVVEGRKVAGSAQTRQRGMILQHGSILLDLDVDLLFDVLRFPSERVKERMKRTFLGKAAAINQLRRSPVTLEEAEKAFAEGFARGLGVRLVEGELTPYEQKLAEELVRNRYAADEWNMRR